MITAAHAVPFVLGAALVAWLRPVLAPISLVLLAHAWGIPELYAARGANVVRARRRARAAPEQVALGLLGDLVEHAARELHAETGLMLEAGSLGVWLIGETGAVLVRPGGRRVHCYCVKVTDPSLPPSDGLAHLL